MENLKHAALLGGMVASLGGCPDTEGAFNRFHEDYVRLHPPGMTGDCGVVCVAPAAGEVDGDFVFALSASIDPTNPVLFDADITTADGAAGLEFTLTLQGLSKTDRTTPVGDSLPLGPFPVMPDATFTAEFPPLTVTGMANPFSDNDITAEVTLEGTLCPGDFNCGCFDGAATSPAMIPLPDSSYAIERLEAPGTFPAQPRISCTEGEVARPL